MSGADLTKLRHDNQKGANVQCRNIPRVEQHIYTIHDTHGTGYAVHEALQLDSTQPLHLCVEVSTIYTYLLTISVANMS